MGSRRSFSIADVVGKSRKLSAKRSQLTSEIGKANPEGIASKSAELIASSTETGDFFYYGLKLINFLRKIESQISSLSDIEMDKSLRKEWSSIKRKEGVKDDPVLDKAVIDAAKEALKIKK